MDGSGSVEAVLGLLNLSQEYYTSPSPELSPSMSLVLLCIFTD